MTNEERSKISINQILDSAIEEFGENGFEGISLNQLCAKSNISKGKLYHHFSNKEELYFSCIQKSYFQLSKILASFKPNTNESYQRNLHDYFELRTIFFFDHPYSALLMHQAMQNPIEPLKEQINSLRLDFQEENEKNIFNILKDIPLQRGASINIIIKMFEIASTYVHLVHGFGNWDPKQDMSEIIAKSAVIFDSVLEILLYGVLPRE